MRQKLEKLQGHTDQLLGCYLGVARKYALLEPMISEVEVQRAFGSGARQRGFQTIRYALFHDCVANLVNLASDTDKRTPSVVKLLEELDDAAVVAALRDHYSVYVSSREEGLDQDWHDFFDASDKARRKELRAEFDCALAGVRERWASFQRQPWLPSFHVIRDKIVAHLELRNSEGKYTLAGPPQVKLKLTDLGVAMRMFEPIVLDLNRVVRGAGFLMESATGQFEEWSRSYWEVAR